MKLLAAIIVVGFALFLIGLAILSFARAALVARFFMAFASSARTHFAEQAVRLLVGASLVVLAPVMWQPGMFTVVGWAVVITSVGLMLTPWQWHQRFGEKVLPGLVRHLRLFALGLLGFGVLLLGGVLLGHRGGA